MALETKRAAVNSAVDTLVTALADLYDGIGANEAVIFVGPGNTAIGLDGTPATTPTWSTDPKIQPRIYIHRGPKTAGAHEINNFWGGPTEGGYFWPVWKLTNDTGELS